MDVEQVHTPFQHKGLEVLWIFGEGNDGGPYPLQAVEQFVKNTGVQFPVLRDHLFANVFEALPGKADTLPIQYILDAETMEIRHVSVGSAEVAWDILDELLDD